MFCKNCSSEVDSNAVVCLKCGCDPRLGDKYCNSCGVSVNDNQIACIKCGNSVQKKKVKNEYDGLYRSSDDKVILGFCGGIAHKFELPVAVVRLVMFLAAWFFVGWFYFIGIFFPKLPTKNV